MGQKKFYKYNLKPSLVTIKIPLSGLTNIGNITLRILTVLTTILIYIFFSAV